MTEEPTQLEEANFVKHASAGALYTDTCPCHTAKPEEHCETSCEHCDLPGDCDKVRVFEIALVQARITYNRYGWHDPEGRFFVRETVLNFARRTFCRNIWRKMRFRQTFGIIGMGIMTPTD